MNGHELEQEMEEHKLEFYTPFVSLGGYHRRDPKRWPKLKDIEEADVVNMDRRVTVRIIGVN